MLNNITNTRGATALTGVCVEMVGKHCKIETKRKYQLAYFLNYNNKLFGKKVSTLYLDVLTKLELNLKGLLFIDWSSPK